MRIMNSIFVFQDPTTIRDMSYVYILEINKLMNYGINTFKYPKID